MGFYYAPPPSVDNEVGGPIILAAQQAAQGAAGWSRSMVSGTSLALTKLWA
jgi:hypothetical protein